MGQYVIMVDENDQAYLAHALFGRGRGVRQNHKYILKIGEGRQARYFYTQEEIAAYKRELQNAAKKTVNNVKNNVKEVTGYGAKERLSDDKKNLDRAREVRSKAYFRNEEARANAMTTQSTANMYKSISDHAVFNKKGKKKNAELMQNRADKANAAYERSSNNLNDAQSAYDKYRNQYNKDSNKYDRSLAGVVDKVKSKSDRMKEEFRNKKEKPEDAKKSRLKVTTTDKDGNKTVYEGKDARKYIGGMIKDQAKQQLSEKKEEIKDKAGDALDSALEPVKKAVRSVSADIDNKTGKSSKDAADYFKKIAEQATTEEERARAKEYEGYNREDYEKSLMGKAEKAVSDAKEKVKDTAKKVAEKASDLDAKVGMKIDDAVWDASNKLNIKGKEVHDEYSKLREEYHKNPSPELEAKAEKVYQEWLKTPHGKVTNSTGGFGSNGLVGDVAWQAEKGVKKVKELSEAQAAKIREKLNDGLNVSKEDMSALWKYYTNK